MNKDNQRYKTKPMTREMFRAPYEAPDIAIITMGIWSVICSSWDDGYIPDDDYNSFDEE